MDFLTSEILQSLGVSAVLAIFLFLAWKRINEKDERIREITDSLQAKYEENTKMTERVNNTLDQNSKSIQKNTETLERVLEKFNDVMRRNRSGNRK